MAAAWARMGPYESKYNKARLNFKAAGCVFSLPTEVLFGHQLLFARVDAHQGRCERASDLARNKYRCKSIYMHTRMTPGSI
jgi:hypothetical protein